MATFDPKIIRVAKDSWAVVDDTGRVLASGFASDAAAQAWMNRQANDEGKTNATAVGSQRR